MSNIRPEFRSHDVTPDQITRIQTVREGFSTLLDEIEQLVPAGRDRALVVTKLQEASMFAVRGIAAPASDSGRALRDGPPAITTSSTAA